MPGATIVHAAVFAAGAVIGATFIILSFPFLSSSLLGGGLAAAVTSHQRPTPVASPSPQPVIRLNPKGIPEVIGTHAAAIVASPILKYGNPGPIPDFLVRKAYVMAYDRRLRHAAWTAEHLTLSSLGKSGVLPTIETTGGDRSRSTFREDEDLPAQFRSKLSDYFRSGYDRGHMVPAADAKVSQEAMDETFLLSNMAPQVGQGFNRNYWAYLEDWCRRLTSSFADVYVFTIPLYLPKLEADGKWRVTHEVIGSPPNVAVPTHFAKVVLTSKPTSPSAPDLLEISTGAFVLPNAIIPDEAPLTSFVMPVDAVERAAGLILFSDAIKANSKHICQSTKCEVLVRHFDDVQKKGRKAIAAPR
ncbi:hypothetical protein DL96DRAFT_1455966 [Flagelloscypha sp. PMI_526]|nr:hypothetical protein DL96DRAFT_1455966 [Flagelloscypha sp. PMI_526]